MLLNREAKVYGELKEGTYTVTLIKTEDIEATPALGKTKAKKARVIFHLQTTDGRIIKDTRFENNLPYALKELQHQLFQDQIATIGDILDRMQQPFTLYVTKNYHEATQTTYTNYHYKEYIKPETTNTTEDSDF